MMHSQLDMSEIKGTKDNTEKTCASLPIEMITEILTWLPVTSLLQFKCVCKEWLSITQHWPFIYRHHRRAPLLEYSYRPNKQVRTCYGLLVERCLDTEKLRIMNPSTHQAMDLPNSCWQGSFISICLLQSSGTFKLVSVKDGGWAVLTLGTNDRSWKILRAPESPELDRRTSFLNQLVTNDAVYHVQRVFRQNALSAIEVESFDLETETLTKTSLPTGFFSELSMVKGQHWDNRLALTYKGEKEFSGLVLEDYRSGRWSTQKIVIPLGFIKDYSGLDIYWDALLKVGKRMLFLDKDKKAVFVYDTISGKVELTYSVPEGKQIPLLLRHSLVSLKGMQTRSDTIVTHPYSIGFIRL